MYKVLEFIKTNKKISIAIGIVILIVLIFLVYFLFIPKEKEIPITIPEYDIQKDYCGKVIDSHYCQCAFEGENCEAIGSLSKEDTYKLVNAGFESWLIEKKKELCVQKDGRWVDDVCRK